MKDPGLGVNFKGDGGDQSDIRKKDQSGWSTCWAEEACWVPVPMCGVFGVGGHLGLSLQDRTRLCPGVQPPCLL